jgi:methyl-accepting chemotaxis protein
MEIQQAIEELNAIDSQITEAIDLMATIIQETLKAVEEILS